MSSAIKVAKKARNFKFHVQSCSMILDIVHNNLGAYIRLIKVNYSAVIGPEGVNSEYIQNTKFEKKYKPIYKLPNFPSALCHLSMSVFQSD